MFAKFFSRPASVLVALVWAATLLSVPPAQATTARMASLGGGDFIEDDHNVQRWYGSLGDYPDLLLVEGGHFTLPAGWHDNNGQRISGPGLGLHLGLDAAGRWGTAALFLNDQGDDVDPGSLARDHMGTTWAALWSRSFGAVQPTLILRRGTDNGEATVNTDGLIRSWDRSRTEVGLGLRWDVSDGTYLDLAGEVRRHREQTTVHDTELTVAGPTHGSDGSFGLRARAFIRLNPTMALVPLVEYLREDRPLSAQSPIINTNLDGHLVKLGTGLNWYPDPDHFLVLGVDYLHGEADFFETPSGSDPILDSAPRWDSLSLTLGFESRFQYWLTFRGSLRYEPVDLNETDTVGPDDIAADFATFRVNLGAAIQLGNYDLDLALTDQEPGSVAGYYGHSLFDNPDNWLTMTLRRSWGDHAGGD